MLSTKDPLKLEQIRKALETHNKGVVEQFHKKHAQTLNFAKKHSLALASAAIVTAATLGATYTYSHGHAKARQHQESKDLDSFVKQIGALISHKTALSKGEEDVIAAALSKKFGVSLKASLDGNRLNEIFGYMGAEQHLRRWAGDNLAQHDLQQSGMAPLQGAFKDFDSEEQERYYVAVQLHELPNWNKEWHTLKPWYKYRKVFVFNPANQRGVIAVIGDAGPSKFTGKTFGGSPEIMEYLQMKDGGQKGQALVLFVDDSENKIALGPVWVADHRLAEK